MFWDGVFCGASSGRWRGSELWPLCGLWLFVQYALNVVVGAEVCFAGVLVKHF